MVDGHTNRNHFACSSSPHSMGCILFARRILRMQEIEKTKNQTTSPGDTKVAFLQSVANLTRAKKCITQGNKNHPEEEQDFEPPTKIETRSQVCCLCDKYLLLRR